MRPPRALWVPFELGRPFGPPNQRDFQLDVLRALLALLERKSGPVLEDYPQDAPAGGEDDEAWSCPLPLPPLPAASTPGDRLRQSLLAELSSLTPWYVESARRRGRSTFGLSGLKPDDTPAIAEFLASLAVGESPEIPAGVAGPLPGALRAMADDLKAYYLEAAAAQPGMAAPSGVRLTRWLFHETSLGQVLYDIRDRLAAEAAATVRSEQAPPGPPPVALVPNRFRERPPPHGQRLTSSG